MRILFTSLALFLAVLVFAADPKYPANTIPQPLLKNADVVKRYEAAEFEISDLKTTTYHYKSAYTILNENGDRYAEFSEWYDKFRHIQSVEGYLYDKDGNQLKKMKLKDAEDVSAIDDNNLSDDNRVKRFNFYYKAYPYTVEFEVTIKIDQTFWMPNWSAQEFKNLAVEQSSYTVITPQDYNLRYKMFNYKGEPLISTENNKKKYNWHVEKLPAVSNLFAAPRWHELTPYVSIAPSNFAVENYIGSMSDWKEYGKFVYALKKDKDVLPADVKTRVAQLTANATTDLEKVQILYQYLQQNTRYISIQLGIGGWQPFDAGYVAKKGYGDCKALSNYMYSLLKAANIKSFYTLIRAGHDTYMMDDFPSTQFNHAILCVPLQKDTMWLECTSQTVPAGYMGDFTGNRKALLIDEEGGTLVSTPRYGLTENLLNRTAKAHLNEEGTLTMKVETIYKGTQQDDLTGMVNALSKDKIEKVLQHSLELATYKVNSFNYQESKSILPQLNEQLEIEVDNYATIAGRRLFITPNLLNRSHTKITEDEERTADFVFEDEWKDEDQYEIEVPGGYDIEAAPSDVSIKTKYGSYSSSVKLEGNKLIYHRVREQYKCRAGAKEQNDLIKYYADIYKADRARIVFVKKS